MNLITFTFTAPKHFYVNDIIGLRLGCLLLNPIQYTILNKILFE